VEREIDRTGDAVVTAAGAAALALALLVVPIRSAARLDRLRPQAVTRKPRKAARKAGRENPATAALRLAACLDLLASCLRAGLPVQAAVRAVAGGAPPRVATALRSTADLLAFGAEPADAWAPVRACAEIGELARAATRTARSGTALAAVAADLSARLRATLDDQAEAKAQRAGVLITAPLGLCFLPAFFCLGVVPVVLGFAGHLSILT
jgi:pilus assembly protein TadC